MNRKLKSSLSMFLSAAIAASSVNVVASADTSYTEYTVDDTAEVITLNDADYTEEVVASGTENNTAVSSFAPETIPTPEPVYDEAVAAELGENFTPISCGSGVELTIDENGVLTVYSTGSGTGDMTDFESSSYAARSDWYTYMAYVKEIVISDGVKTIGDYVFHGFANVKKVTIGKDVTEIGKYAFYNNYSLETLDLTGAAALLTIGDYSFYDCTVLKSLTLPDVTSIGDYAFSGCKAITEVTIPASVGDNFGTDATTSAVFYGCSSLTKVTIEEGVTAIRNVAFSGCAALEEITLPSTLTYIGNEAFYGCSALSKINDDSDCFTVPKKVTTIGENAFANCTSIKALIIEGGVETIGKKAFSACSELTAITITGEQKTTIGEAAFMSCGKLIAVTLNNGNVTKIDKQAFYQSGVQNISLSPTLTTIGESAFAETQMVAVSIPASVETIGISAFEANYKLKNVSFVARGENAVSLSLGKWAFGYCTAIESINLEGVNSFGVEAFIECTALKSVEIPSTTTYMGTDVFENCTSLTKLTIAEGAEYIGAFVVKGCPITSVSIPASVLTTNSAFKDQKSLTKLVTYCSDIDNNAFEGCSNLADITFNNLTAIRTKAFLNCASITEMNIPDTVTTLGQYVFGGCSSLESISVPNTITAIPIGLCSGCVILTSAKYGNVTAINDEAFENCYLLTGAVDAIFPASLLSIGESAFENCVLLTSAPINNVTSLGASAFKGCTGLKTAYLSDSLKAINDNLFNGCTALTTVTGASTATKIGASAFNDCSVLAGYTIPSTVTYIGKSAFCNCSLFDSAIPSGVTSLNANAFQNCISLGKNAVVDIPAGINKIDTYVFAGCTSLPSMAIPDNITLIGNSAFEGCTSDKFTTMALSEAVESIGNNAYAGCTNLTLVRITSGSESCTKLGSYAFANCTKLADVSLPTTIETIGTNTFENCSALTSINLPSSVTAIGAAAFKGCTKLTSATISGTKIKLINNDLFNGCVSLKSIEIPNTVTDIKANAFMNCSALNNVAIPGTVAAIRKQAFSGCSSLEFIVLPVALRTFDAQVFANCPNLESVIYLSMYSPAANTAFFESTDKLTVYCYEGSAFVNTFAEKNGINYGYLAGSDGSYVVILRQPKKATGVEIGDIITLNAKVASEGTITYQWFYKNPGDEKFTEATDFTKDTYTMTVSAETDGQQVYCHVSSVSATDEDVTNEQTSNVVYITTLETPVVALSSRAPEAVAIKWDAIKGAEGYKVYRSTTPSGEKTLLTTAPIAALTYTDKTITVGETYYYFVTACNSSITDIELETNYSEALNVSVPAPVAPVTNVSAEPGNGKVTVSWDAVENAESYLVYTYNGSELLSKNSTKDSSYTVTGLVNGTKYTFKVKVLVDGIWSDFSAAVTAAPVVKTIPENVKATAGTNEVTVTWDALDGATQYLVYTYNGDTFVSKNTVTGTSYTVTGLAGGTKYTFKVKAYVDGAWGGFSAAAAATPEKPAVPANVKATAGAGQVKVSWDAFTGATQYLVYTYNGDTLVSKNTTTSTSYTVTGLTGGTKYTFKVKAYVDGAWSGFSEAAAATPTANTIPQNVKATVGAGQVKVSWSAVDNATQYLVYTYDGSTLVSKKTAADTSFTVTGLTAGIQYTFKVKALVNGAWGAFSDAAYGTPTIATVPTNVKAAAGAGQATVSWNGVNGAAQYLVYTYDGSTLVSKKTATGTSYTVTGLTAGIQYTFKVKAYVNNAWGALSAGATATPTAALVPTNVKAAAGAGQATVSWNGVNGAAQYLVYTYDGSTLVSKKTATGTSYTVTGLTAGTKYTFKVKALVNGAWGGFSAAATATPTASTIPANVKAAAGASQATVSWNSVNGATQYLVYTYDGSTLVSKKTATGTSYTVTGLTAGTKYTFKVKAYVNNAWSGFSSGATATPNA